MSVNDVPSACVVEAPEATVIRICRYPIKGLGGEAIERVEIGSSGIPYDRAVALATGWIPVAPYGQWTTYDAFSALSTDARLGLGRACVVLGPVETRPDLEVAGPEKRPLLDPAGTGLVEVVWDGQKIASLPVVNGRVDVSQSRQWTAVIGDERISQAEAAGVSLWDVETAQISIINLATVRELSDVAGVEMEPERFRGNLYIDGLPAWEELGLVGKQVRVGGATLEVFAPIERCRATSAQPGGTAWNLNIPGLLATYFGHACVGVYGRVVKPGEVGVGNTVKAIGGKHAKLDGPDSECVSATSPRRCAVVAVTSPSPRVRSITVRDPFEMLEDAAPGQYLRVHGGVAAKSWRNYTISRVESGLARLTVQCREDGRFSPSLRDVGEGDTLLVSGPYGSATLDDAESAISIVTAGIGITPALRLMQHLADRASRRRVRLTHVARDRADIPHLDELQAAITALDDCSAVLFLTSPVSREADGAAGPWDVRQGRPAPHEIAERIARPDDASEAEVFTCGSTAFVEVVVAAARGLGVAEHRIHRDPFYSPPETPPERKDPPHPGPFSVRWGTAAETAWSAEDGSLLDLAERAGLRPAASCRAGVCGTCAYSVEGDTAALVDALVEPARGKALLCATVPRGDLVVDFDE